MDERRDDAASTEMSDVVMTSGLVGSITGRDVALESAAAGFVAAEGNVSVINGGCGPVFTNGSVTITNGGCGPMIANGDVSIENGGTQAILAAGGARIGPRAFVGLVASPSVTVEDGGRVLFGPREALAFGAVAGLVFAVLSRVIRR
ncbi:MAG TPA: hypothetical protein VIE12_07200 [Actinomycetota bacterium]|jgi:hypothetical protein